MKIKQKNIIKLLTIISLALIGAWLFVKIFNPKVSKENKDLSTFVANSYNVARNSEAVFSDNETGKIPVLIYSLKEGSFAKSDGQKYSRLSIWRKIGNNPDEKLTNVESDKSYLSNIEITPDKQSLLLGSGNKIQLLDLKTKKLNDLFVPKDFIYDFKFSPKGDKLLIWDQLRAPSNADSTFYIHEIDWDTKRSKILKQGEGLPSIFMTWRDDNKIILFSGSAYYYLEGNEIKKIDLPIKYGGGQMSEDGKLITLSSSYTNNVCNDFSGFTDDAYLIFELTSGKELGRIEDLGKNVMIRGFSEDGKFILFSSNKTSPSKESCDNFSPQYNYYITEISGKNKRGISEKEATALLKTWKVWGTKDVFAIHKFGPEKSEIITTKGKKVIEADSLGALNLIFQYYLDQ